MKKFIYINIILLLTTFILAYSLEWFYTYSYQNSSPENSRSKVSWLNSKDSVIKYDYALFGSSRCIYHLNPVTIDNKTGLNGINLGYSGSNPFEIKLMVKKFLNKYSPKEIFIQVDDRFNREFLDTLSITSWIPFINNDYIYQEISGYDDRAFYLKNVPFYRYTQYESKLGFRNLFFSYFKKNKFHHKKGFVEIKKEIKSSKPLHYKLEDKPNKHFKEINKWCEERGVKVYFFTAPYYKTKINTEIIDKYLNNYHDFSFVFSEMKLFSDQTHLNWKGAEKFTNIFIEYYFTN
jgi:hypothetical protein